MCKLDLTGYAALVMLPGSGLHPRKCCSCAFTVTVRCPQTVPVDSGLLAQQPAVANVPVGPPSQTASSDWKFDFAFSEAAPDVTANAGVMTSSAVLTALCQRAAPHRLAMVVADLP